jgi:hypothetical protein
MSDATTIPMIAGHLLCETSVNVHFVKALKMTTLTSNPFACKCSTMRMSSARRRRWI